nr:kinase [Propionibacterium sp.]
MTQPPRPAVFAGLATLDVVHRVARLPGPDEKVTATAVEVTAGGPAANAAKTLAALGGRARLVTALGADPVAGLVRADLESFGVEVVDLASGRPGIPPVASVLVTETTGQRAVVNSEGFALPDVPPLDELVAGAASLLVDGHHPTLALAAARAARAAGVPVVADAGRPRPVWERLLPLTDVAICSAEFRVGDAPAGGFAAAALHAVGVRRVAITAGAGPLAWWDADTRASGELRPPTVTAVDTLGAGDVLHGAFCFHAERGLGFADALAAASRLAAARCTRWGLNAWLRSLRA